MRHGVETLLRLYKLMEDELQGGDWILAARGLTFANVLTQRGKMGKTCSNLCEAWDAMVTAYGRDMMQKVTEDLNARLLPPRSH